MRRVRNGDRDPQQCRPVWRRPSVWLVSIAVGVLAMVVSAVFTAWFVNEFRQWKTIAGLAGTVVLILSCLGPPVLALFVRARHGALWAEPSSPVVSMRPRERRQLMQALRGNGPIPADQHETAKIVLRRDQRARWINVYSWGLLFIGTALSVVDTQSPALRWFQGGIAVVAITSFTVSGWRLIQYRRIARSLQTPEREGTADDADAE